MIARRRKPKDSINPNPVRMPRAFDGHAMTGPWYYVPLAAHRQPPARERKQAITEARDKDAERDATT